MKYLIVGLILLFSCGVPQSEYDKILSEKDSLATVVSSLQDKIEELQNGEQRLIDLIENSYKSNKYIDSQKYIQVLLKKHPESGKYDYYKQLLVNIQGDVEKELMIIEKQKQDSIRLANINELGIWGIGHYVDDFGEKTKEGYIYTVLHGTFSNSATTNSDLRVSFLIDDENSIALKLYEYSGKNPVKENGINEVLVQDKEGDRYRLIAHNNSDRLQLSDYTEYHDDKGHTLAKNHSAMLWKILMKGGTVKFKIIESNYSTSEYNFIIENADWLENAYEKLKAENSAITSQL